MRQQSLAHAFLQNFLGHTLPWYKNTIIGIFFLKDLLLYMVTKPVVKIRSKMALMLSFSTVTWCYPRPWTR